MGIKSVPEINPRQRLTKKARRAIDLYVSLHGDKYSYMADLVTWTLRAERMRRDTLYQWLEDRGYRWKPRSGWLK